MKKVSDIIIEYLSTIGIKKVFFVPGGGAMHMNNSLGLSDKAEAVSMLFEQGAAIAAEAYARSKNGFGACLVTSGPGGTNALTGLVGAYIDSIPVIFISGQVKRDDLIGNQGIRQFGIQEVNIVKMAKPYAKYAVMVEKAEDILYELQKASAIAADKRPGPVWLDIPLDIQASVVDEETLRTYEKAEKALLYSKQISVNKEEYEAKESDITKVIELLNKSERPLLYIGHGIRLDHAEDLCDRLVEKLGIPVLTSWNGVDLIEENNPYYMGRPGGVGHRHANLIQHKADLVITIGTRLNLLATGYNFESFLENATHVMVDIDEAEMDKKSIHPQVKVLASAYSFAEKLLKRSDEIHISEEVRRNWLAKCREIKEKYPIRIEEQKAREGFVCNYELISEISERLTPKDIYQFTSSGTTVDIAMKVFEIKKGQRAFLTKGLAAMGYDLPASIGSAMAMLERKERGQVVCVTGDGSIAMNIQELEVVKRLRLPIKIFISDNSGYSMIYGSQSGNFKRLTGCNEESGLTLPDYTEIARAFGIYTVSIDKPEELKKKVKEVLEMEGPVVCRVKTDIEQKILPRQCNYMNKDGQMASRPLHDMAPLIDEKELERI